VAVWPLLPCCLVLHIQAERQSRRSSCSLAQSRNGDDGGWVAACETAAGRVCVNARAARRAEGKGPNGQRKVLDVA
jgi:hypothetical protein